MSPNPATGHFLVITNPAYFQYIKLTVFFKYADFLCYHFLRDGVIVFTSLPEKFWPAIKQSAFWRWFLALVHSHLIIVAQIDWRTDSK
jgi:hypothetical protein